MDELFGQASAAVRSRADIVDQLETLQDPPDLRMIVAAQQRFLTAEIAGQVSRCTGAATRLHELLVVQLSTKTAKITELNMLTNEAELLQDLLDGAQEGSSDVDDHREAGTEPTAFDRTGTALADEFGLEPADGPPRLKELENRQVTLLDSVLPKAREQREFRALVTEWEVQRRDIVQSLESAMLSVALTALNTASAEQTAPRMKVKSFDGLRASLTNDRIVLTDAYDLLEAKICQRNEGSFGIAGPRGVGKSTLIRFFTTTDGVSGPAAPDGQDRPRLGAVVSAPVAYDPREFVLHLYAELCKRVIGEGGDSAIRRGRELDPEPSFYGVPLRRARNALTIIGTGAFTGGLGLLTLAVAHRLPWAWHWIADTGAALFTVAVLMVITMLLYSAGLRPVFDRGIRVRVLRTSRTWLVAMNSALTVAGLTLLFAGGGWSGGTWPFLTAEALFVMAFPALWASRMVRQLQRLAMTVAGKDDVVPSTADAKLRELAFDHLSQIRYQQSFSRERSMAVKIGGGPAGIDAGGKRGETWQELPKTYPELVADLRAFLAAAAERYTMVIGVDELDKLRSHEEVEDFLNDIKGIFGASGCFFLVSVSEDAAASFERRGTPFRDVFDSAFDEVISVRQLDLRCARKVVYGLLLGWTKPFVDLCYVLSGGLARDLRRSARELITYRDENSEIELGGSALAMCRLEAEARIQAIRHELMRDPLNPLNVDLLTLVVDFAPADATAPILRQWHDKLVAWTGECEAVPIPPAVRLGLEIAAFLLFAATVIEFFDPAAPGERIREAEKVDGGAGRLSTLAMARRSLALSPRISLEYTRKFRAAWGFAN
jgi:hypothetical protein